MKILQELNCKYFISYKAQGEYKEELGEGQPNLHRSSKYLIKTVEIHQIRLDDLVEYIYELVEPSNNLNDPVTRETFCALTLEQQKNIAANIIIYRYCIHRILVLCKLYEPENWMFKTVNDYYGEEVDIICLKPEVATTVDEHLRYLTSKTNAKRIEYVLNLEYGHLIPAVTDRDWQIIQTDVSQMIFSNMNHLEKCQKENKDYLKTYKLPRAIATQQVDGKYKVVDGYCRICAAENDKFLIIYTKEFR